MSTSRKYNLRPNQTVLLRPAKRCKYARLVTIKAVDDKWVTLFAPCDGSGMYTIPRLHFENMIINAHS